MQKERRKKKARSTVHEKSHVFTYNYTSLPPSPLLSPHSGFVSSQPQPHPHRGSVRVHHTVVVHTAMVAQPDGSVVRLVHTKENVDRVWREGGEQRGEKVERPFIANKFISR